MGLAIIIRVYPKYTKFALINEYEYSSDGDVLVKRH